MDNKLVLVKGSGENKDNGKPSEKVYLRVDYDEYRDLIEKLGKIYGHLEAGCSALKGYFDSMDAEEHITTGAMETISDIFTEGITKIDNLYQELDNLKNKDPDYCRALDEMFSGRTI